MAAELGVRKKLGEHLVEFLEDGARVFGDRTALLYKPGFRYMRWSYEDLWAGSGMSLFYDYVSS